MIIATRLLRDRRRTLLWWALGLVAVVVLTVSLYPSVRGEASFDDLVEDLPEAVKGVVGYQNSVPLTSAPGYLHGRLFATGVPLVMVIFGIGAARKRSVEASKRAPSSRCWRTRSAAPGSCGSDTWRPLSNSSH